MKASDFVSALIHFFNDFIGAVVPGLLLIGGLALVTSDPTWNLVMESFSGIQLLALLVAAFTAGHVLLALNRALQSAISFLLKAALYVRDRKWPKTRSGSNADGNLAYEAFHSKLREKLSGEKELDFHTVRSIAMSISADAAELGRRFMFIALFCYASGLASLIVGITDVLVHGLHTNTALRPAVCVVAAMLLYTRAQEFKARALRTPFSAALANMIFPGPNAKTEEREDE